MRPKEAGRSGDPHWADRRMPQGKDYFFESSALSCPEDIARANPACAAAFPKTLPLSAAGRRFGLQQIAASSIVERVPNDVVLQPVPHRPIGQRARHHRARRRFGRLHRRSRFLRDLSCHPAFDFGVENVSRAGVGVNRRDRLVRQRASDVRVLERVDKTCVPEVRLECRIRHQTASLRILREPIEVLALQEFLRAGVADHDILCRNLRSLVLLRRPDRSFRATTDRGEAPDYEHTQQDCCGRRDAPHSFSCHGLFSLIERDNPSGSLVTCIE